MMNKGQTHGRAYTFESQYNENAPRRRVSLSSRLKLVIKHPYARAASELLRTIRR